MREVLGVEEDVQQDDVGVDGDEVDVVEPAKGVDEILKSTGPDISS